MCTVVEAPFNPLDLKRAILRQAGVKECVVFTRASPPKAYVVLASGTGPRTSAILESIRVSIDRISPSTAAGLVLVNLPLPSQV